MRTGLQRSVRVLLPGAPISFEMNPDPRFLAPDDAARQTTVVGLDH